MSNVITAPTARKEYERAGWQVITRIPEGQKFRPTTGTSGRVPFAERVAAAAAQEWLDGDNLALVLATDSLEYGLIALDVDQYEDKQGRDALAEKERVLGDLNLESVPRSTRRGLGNDSGQYFFKVPKGLTFKESACHAVEVIQSHHRYSVVWPSQVDGLTYRWYVGGNEIEVPHVEDLPWLPSAWVEDLTKSTSGKELASKSHFETDSEAYDWLRSVYDPHPEHKEDDSAIEVDWQSGSRHDAMRDASCSIVSQAVFYGTPGLFEALEELEAQYNKALGKDFTPARSKDFSRAVAGAIALVRGEVEAGRKPYSWTFYKDCEIPNLWENLLPGYVHINRESIIWQSTRLASIVEAVFQFCPKLIAYTSDEEDNEIRYSDSRVPLTPSRLRGLLNGDVADFLDEELINLPEELEENSLEERLYKRLKALKSDVESLNGRTLNPLLELLTQRLIRAGKSMPKSKLNKAAHLIGVGDEVLDLDLASANPGAGLAGWLRPRTVADCVTHSVPGNIRAGLVELEKNKETVTERFLSTALPDTETRRFVQAALGYSIYGANELQKVFVFYGSGGSGKTSLFHSMEATLGRDYVSTLKLSQFAKSQSTSPDPSYAASLDTRVTFIDETDKGDRLNAGVIKSATEERTARSLYSNKTVRSDSNTVFFMTNNVFHLDVDSGIDRRLAIVPFNADRVDVRDAQYSPVSKWREQDAERAYMLSWLVEGYLVATERDSILHVENYPPSIKEATKEFLRVADPTQAFFAKLTYTGNEDDFIASTDLCSRYRAVTGEALMKPRAISMKIGSWIKDQNLAHTKAKVANVNGYRGWVYDSD